MPKGKGTYRKVGRPRKQRESIYSRISNLVMERTKPKKDAREEDKDEAEHGMILQKLIDKKK